jgi:hypothetical protein
VTADMVREIENAFSGTVLPAAAALMNNHCSECVETSRLFWNEQESFVTWQEAARRPGSYVESALLTAEAWRYYLPALMIWCVRDTESVNVLLDNLVHGLTPPATSDRAWFAPRSVGFTSQQRLAIAAFLRWDRDRERAEWASIGADPPDDAASALDYWGGPR